MSIPPISYKCDEFFKLEKEKIFKKSWIPVAYTNDFNKNNIIQARIHNIPIILTKNKKGKINA